MKIARGLALAALLGMLGTASAQLKPSSPTNPPLPPSKTESQRAEAQASKELAARMAAERWLALLDAGEYGKAWDGCAQLFRQRVTRQQWIESLPPTRSAFGALKERHSEVATYKTSLPGAPDGEYVTVRFSSQFEKKADAEELLTLILEDGAWRPTGYFIR